MVSGQWRGDGEPGRPRTDTDTRMGTGQGKYVLADQKALVDVVTAEEDQVGRVGWHIEEQWHGG